MLTTTANIKTYLGISGSSEDTLLTLLLGFADRIVKSFVGWDIEKKTITNQVRDWSKFIHFNGYPLSSTGLKVEYNSGTVATPVWSNVPTSDYVVHYDEGIIEFLVCYEGNQNIRLSGDIGYASASIPTDVEFVVIKFVSRMYNKRKSEGIASESLESANVSWKDEMSADEREIIEKYKLKIFV